VDLALRPRRATEIVDASVRLYRRHFGPFFTLSVAAAVPTLLLQLASIALTRGAVAATAAVTAVAILGVLAVPLYVAYTTVVSGAFAALSDDAVQTDAPDVGRAARRGVGRAWACLGALLLFGVAMAGGLLLLVLPGLYVAARLATIVPTVVVEDAGPVEAFRRAWARSRGHGWHSFAVLLVCVVIVIAPLLASGMLSAALDLQGASAGARVLGAVLEAGVSALITPLFPLATQVLYYDLRVRAEGYDLEQMVGALGAAGAAPAGA
jgi:hypothetical protein